MAALILLSADLASCHRLCEAGDTNKLRGWLNVQHISSIHWPPSKQITDLRTDLPTMYLSQSICIQWVLFDFIVMFEGFATPAGYRCWDAG